MPTDKDRINIYLDPEMKERVKTEADRIGVTMSGFINFCISEYLHQHDAMNVFNLVDKVRELMEKSGTAPDQGAGRG